MEAYRGLLEQEARETTGNPVRRTSLARTLVSTFIVSIAQGLSKQTRQIKTHRRSRVGYVFDYNLQLILFSCWWKLFNFREILFSHVLYSRSQPTVIYW